jgi:hypothetical protein
MTHLERHRGSFRTYVTSHSLFFTMLCVSATFCISFHTGSPLCVELLPALSPRRSRFNTIGCLKNVPPGSKQGIALLNLWKASLLEIFLSEDGVVKWLTTHSKILGIPNYYFKGKMH